ncbi:phosphotransferase enzyme family protein [Candidatus Bipolaricaulota bacterium]
MTANNPGSEAPLGRPAFPSQSSVLDEHALLHRIVSEYSVDNVRTCRFLSRGDSDIYRVVAERANFYLKVYRPPMTKSQAEAEARLVEYLAKHSVPVVSVVRRSDGEYASEVLASEGSRAILLFEEAPPALPPQLEIAHMHALGEVLACLHDAADIGPRLGGLPTIDLDSIVADWVPSILRFADEDAAAFLDHVIGHIRPQLSEIPREIPNWGVCHADLVLSNVRYGSNGVTLFDFGDCGITYRGLEMAILFWSLEHRDLDQRDVLWEAFLNGYGQIRNLPDRLEERLSAFLILRELSFLGGNAATLPLRLGTEPFDSDFMSSGFDRIRSYLGRSGTS